MRLTTISLHIAIPIDRSQFRIATKAATGNSICKWNVKANAPISIEIAINFHKCMMEINESHRIFFYVCVIFLKNKEKCLLSVLFTYAPGVPTAGIASVGVNWWLNCSNLQPPGREFHLNGIRTWTWKCKRFCVIRSTSTALELTPASPAWMCVGGIPTPSRTMRNVWKYHIRVQRGRDICRAQFTISEPERSLMNNSSKVCATR